MSYIKSEDLIKFIDERGASFGLTTANICNFKEIIGMFGKKEAVDLCVVCDDIIPEGRQVCPNCENEKAN